MYVLYTGLALGACNCILTLFSLKCKLSLLYISVGILHLKIVL